MENIRQYLIKIVTKVMADDLKINLHIIKSHVNLPLKTKKNFNIKIRVLFLITFFG